MDAHVEDARASRAYLRLISLVFPLFCAWRGTMPFSENFCAGVMRTGGMGLPRTGFPRFSVAQMESGWFWCTDASWEMRGADGLIGPFESRDDAVKDAWEALGMKEGNDQ
jgi:hypothetical protein